MPISMKSPISENKSIGKLLSVSVRFRYVFLGIVVVSGGFLMLSMNSHIEVLFLSPWPSQVSQHYHIHTHEDRFAIRTQGCSIPYMNPLDVNIQQFVQFPENIKSCEQNYTLLEHNRTHIWVVRENLIHYNTSEWNFSKGVPPDFTCCYNAFYRPKSIVDVTSHWLDDRVEYKSECLNFSDTVEVKDEFVKVNCTYKEKIIYEQYFLFVLKKNSNPKGEKEYNVLVMGIDAVSRLNFHRTMPKTLAYMKSLDAVELMGYNKVGDNTFPNLIPMLLGIAESELNTTCWPSTDSTFDSCPWVWQWYKNAGFTTAIGEDTSNLGTFNYCKIGFIGTPTDYYIHTFIEESQQKAGKNKDFNTHLCMNDQWFYKILLQYIENLTETMRKSKLFGFFWEVSMSHDYLNYPMLIDDSYFNFFKSLHESKYLEETILFLVSDHGIRWGGIRSTKQGRLEERLPFVFVVTPQSFRDNYRDAFKNLKINSQRLTTPFDMHETLVDLINVETQLKDETIAARINEPYALKRGMSLFLPVPDNRTCEAADIADHWCTCHKSVSLSNSSSDAKIVASHLITHLNTMLSGYRQCARLTLDEVTEITELSNPIAETGDNNWREFLIVLRAQPSQAIFEATLRSNADKWSVAGTVSRLNQYGNQSHCVQNYQMKLYCYCINTLESF